MYGYATFSRGFKSGGFNIGGLQPPFQPETLTDYEVGLKSELFDRKLRANLSAFVYDYKDLQVTTTVGLALVTMNAASSRIKGLEAEIIALPVDDLRLSVNAAYLDAKYLNFSTEDPARPELGVLNLAGNYLNLSPKLKVNTELGYTLHPFFGEITPRIDITWTDKVFFSSFNLSGESQRAWTDVAAFVTYILPDSGWRADVYGKNLTNKNVITNNTVDAVFLGSKDLGAWGPPRTFGVQITKKF